LLRRAEEACPMHLVFIIAAVAQIYHSLERALFHFFNAGRWIFHTALKDVYNLLDQAAAQGALLSLSLSLSETYFIEKDSPVRAAAALAK
jgi:hypothetical protein